VDPIGDERVRFNVARVLSGLGPPAPPFPELRAALDTAQQIVARRASKAFLGRVNEALLPFGLSAHPVLAPKRSRAGRVLVPALGLALAAAAWFVVARPAPPPLPAPPPPPVAVAPPVVEAPVTFDRKKILGSVVQLACDHQLGAGFFIDSDRVLTNAHVVCSDDTMLKVQLNDGRNLMGKVVKRDDWFDWALVQVAGASVEPLPLGDSTALTDGEPIALVGSPQGLSFSWNEGKVSFVGRDLLGIGYVQIDASVNPGNSGGPLLNRKGQAVGIVSMKVTSTDGVGLALPVEYIEAPKGEQLARWNEELGRVAKDDQNALADSIAGLDKPLLLQAAVKATGVEVRVLSRSHQGGVELELREGERVLCRESAQVKDWISMERLLQGHPEQLVKRRQILWELKTGALKDVDGAVGFVTLASCDLASLAEDPALVLIGANDGQDRQLLPRDQLMAIHAAQAATEHAVRQVEEASARATTAYDAAAREKWRLAFQAAHARIESAERDRDEAQRYVDTGGPEWVWNRNRKALGQAEQRLHDAEEAERDLERKASQQSVPQEWRR
jgi:serine protease Do